MNVINWIKIIYFANSIQQYSWLLELPLTSKFSGWWSCAMTSFRNYWKWRIPSSHISGKKNFTCFTFQKTPKQIKFKSKQIKFKVLKQRRAFFQAETRIRVHSFKTDSSWKISHFDFLLRMVLNPFIKLCFF